MRKAHVGSTPQASRVLAIRVSGTILPTFGVPRALDCRQRLHGASHRRRWQRGLVGRGCRRKGGRVVTQAASLPSTTGGENRRPRRWRRNQVKAQTRRYSGGKPPVDYRGVRTGGR